jgi:hypothetical protein
MKKKEKNPKLTLKITPTDPPKIPQEQTPRETQRPSKPTQIIRTFPADSL